MKIPIILAFNDIYAPYALVTIISCLENKRPDSFYSFYLLIPDYLSEYDKKNILKDCKRYENCDLDFMSIENFDSFSNEELINQIPNKLPNELEFCVYLGNDIIVNIDLQELEELYQKEIRNNYHIATIKSRNLGVIIFNLTKKQADDIYDLPLKYNAMVKELYSFSSDFHRVVSNEESDFRKIFNDEEIEEAQNNPAIIHYENKPLGKRNILFSNYWWGYAKKSAYYKKIKNPKYNNYIHRLEIYPNHICNLNCKFCGTFSPLAREATFLELDVLEKDIKRLSDLTKGYLKWIRICGGEPLLHPKIAKIFDLLRKYFLKTSRIELVTNALLLPKKNENFWKKCKENNIEINISHYPIKIDFQYIVKKAEQYKLNVHYDNYSLIPKKMFKLFLDLKGKQNVKTTFIRCWEANSCSTLIEGKLYTCSLIPNIRHFNNYFNTNLEVKENDYLDIHTNIDFEQILDFLSTAPQFCKYCDFYKFGNGYIWETTKRTIEEWT